jgi:hypothetical protein
MIRTTLAAATLCLALAGQASAMGPNLWFGVYGPKGNDTGGIIPWTRDNELIAQQLAQENCGYYHKYAVPNSIHRVPGDYISYKCVWEPPGPNSKYRYIRR